MKIEVERRAVRPEVVHLTFMHRIADVKGGDSLYQYASYDLTVEQADEFSKMLRSAVSPAERPESIASKSFEGSVGSFSPS